MDGTKSKFDFDVFYDEWENIHYFAVNRDRYTREEAITLYTDEMGGEYFNGIKKAAVRWGVAGKIDGEPRVGWCLEMDKDGTEPRYCPVWVIY